MNKESQSKVFGVGFQKTGTTTLHVVLEQLGYKVCGYETKLAEKLVEGDLNEALSYFERYDAFEDNPWPLLYKEFDKKYPDSKFILTIRDEDKWWNSLINHFGESHTLMRQWIYGNGTPLNNESLYRKRYRDHNKEVKEYFKDRPNSLLVIDWSENGNKWNKICEFLHKPIPKKKFPHTNKRAYNKQEYLWQQLKLIYFRCFIKPRILKNK